MSLLLSSREVSAGPTVGFQSDVVASPSAAYVSNRKMNAAAAAAAAAAATATASASSSYCCLEKKEEKELSVVTGESAGLVESAESSSIGVAGESTSTTVDGDDEEGEEVQSKLKSGSALGSLGSLEESLPIKRGLSNYFSGKSKSFASLSSFSDVSKVQDLAKSENPFNKRRRILMSCKWSNRSLYNGSLNPTTSMPLLAVLDEDEEDQTEDHNHGHLHHLEKNWNKKMEKQTIEVSDDDDDDDSPPSSPSPMRRKFNNNYFKSGKCFSLTDLQNH
ncbi:uncharacterized protein LOC122075908 [Macadamia integrifolia]|uniref:uncharacterized protein LOC122075908 n=1 Tax=Macadamia integrifolia TaxID=60698 RepID=UPI001C4FD4F6|nr:uncharacterized protein LOC122075908 [Macadamia integrifolia]